MARKILLADDSVMAQNMGRKILADAGYEVITVNNGSAALKKIAEHNPDLIILDVYMPGYSGLEVCQRIKEVAETARTPVLLTVGKLEPFKPEEAKRVRAEGYIVKPFEASELLSALSKLEDKIVPRAESSKPGRFARTIAAMEESNRGRNEGQDSGWKNRIAFPPKKNKKEDADETGDVAARESAKTAETVAPLATAEIAKDGLPQEVTAEEIAAIAAAAQVHAGASTAKEQQGAPESIPAKTEGVAEMKPSERPAEIGSGEESFPAATSAEHKREEKVDVFAPEVRAQGGESLRDVPALPAPRPDEVVTVSVLGSGDGQSLTGSSGNGTGHSVESADLPVTMAAATATATGPEGPRWTAVPAIIDATEAVISLEQEMQKAYAASVTAATAQAEPAFDAGKLSAESSVAGPVLVEAAVARVASREESALAEALSAVANASAEALGAAVTELAAMAGAHVGAAPSIPPPDAFVSSLPNPDTPRLEIGAEIQKETQFHDQNFAEQGAPEERHPTGFGNEPQPRPAEEISSSSAHESQAAEAVSAVAETVVKNESAAGGTGEMAAKKESELTDTTAAAWASWRQIRNTDDGKTSGSDGARSNRDEMEEDYAEHEAPAAMAVAAGAEKNPEEARPGSDPRAIASIVDSVLAELRPKIVEEISRKLGEKK